MKQKIALRRRDGVKQRYTVGKQAKVIKPKIMPKKDCTDKISSFGAMPKIESDISQKEKKEIISERFEEIDKDLKKEGRVNVKDFGTFKVKKVPAKKARMGMNPFTGKPQKLKAKPASKKIKFFPSKKLKEMI